jgi:hypothetical protein
MNETLSIVGANSTLGQPVGIDLPILSDGRWCFIVGDDPRNGFSNDVLEMRAQQGCIATCTPLTLADVVPNYSHVIRSDDASALLSSDLYVLYYCDSRLPAYVVSEIAKELPVGACRLCWKGAAQISAFLMERQDLLDLLRSLFGVLEERIFANLTDCWSDPENISRPPHQELEILSEVLYEVAYDQPTAIRALTMRGLLVQLSPKCPMLQEWVAIAAGRWRLPTGMDVWEGRLRSVVGSILTRVRIVRELRRQQENEVLAQRSRSMDTLRDVVYAWGRREVSTRFSVALDHAGWRQSSRIGPLPRQGRKP